MENPDGIDEAGRQEALFGADAAAYAALCEEGGFDPEDPDLYDRGLAERARADEAAVPDFPRRVYPETEQLGRRIAGAFCDDSGLKEVEIRGSLSGTRGSGATAYTFEANVVLARQTLHYVHPGGPCIVEHSDDRTGSGDYGTTCLDEITDAVVRQGREGLTMSRNGLVLTVRRKG